MSARSLSVSLAALLAGLAAPAFAQEATRSGGDPVDAQPGDIIVTGEKGGTHASGDGDQRRRHHREEAGGREYPDAVDDYHTVNAGKSHLYGFELEIAFRPSRIFDVYASFGHTRTMFDEFAASVGVVNDLSGLEFVYAPHWTVAAGGNLRLDNGLSFNLNANHRSGVYTDVVRPQSLTRVKARTLVNAKIGYRYGPAQISVFANKLLDETYKQYDNYTYDRAILGDPQVFGVLLEAAF
jgi:outer membrane receptor protein involved in Fe transport